MRHNITKTNHIHLMTGIIVSEKWLSTLTPEQQTILKEEVNGNTSQGIRGIYIQDTLYVISGNIIEAYDMNSGEKTGDWDSGLVNK